MSFVSDTPMFSIMLFMEQAKKDPGITVQIEFNSLNVVLAEHQEIQSIFYGTYTGLHTVVSHNTILVYPNPATNQTTVKADARMIGSTFNICDQFGRVLKSGILTEENTLIDLDNLTKGIYLVRFGANTLPTFKLAKS